MGTRGAAPKQSEETPGCTKIPGGGWLSQRAGARGGSDDAHRKKEGKRADIRARAKPTDHFVVSRLTDFLSSH